MKLPICLFHHVPYTLPLENVIRDRAAIVYFSSCTKYFTSTGHLYQIDFFFAYSTLSEK